MADERRLSMEGDIQEDGIKAFYRVYDWMFGDDDNTPLITNLDDFIRITTPIIKGRPRAKAVITTNMEGTREISIQAGRDYASYPKRNGLDHYEEYEIAVEGKYVSPYDILNYGQIGDMKEAREEAEIEAAIEMTEYETENEEKNYGLDPEKWYVLENVPEEIVKKYADFLYLDEFQTGLNILIAAAEQFEELGKYETSEPLKKQIEQVQTEIEQKGKKSQEDDTERKTDR